MIHILQRRPKARDCLRHEWMDQIWNENPRQTSLDVETMSNTLKKSEEEDDEYDRILDVPTGSDPHSFASKTYKNPTWCYHCHAFLWGYFFLFSPFLSLPLSLSPPLLVDLSVCFLFFLSLFFWLVDIFLIRFRNQGFTCQKCHIDVHDKCRHKVGSTCGGKGER
jgi:hypothetical protein